MNGKTPCHLPHQLRAFYKGFIPGYLVSVDLELAPKPKGSRKLNAMRYHLSVSKPSFTFVYIHSPRFRFIPLTYSEILESIPYTVELG